MCRDFLKPHCQHHHCDLLVQYLYARSIQVHFEVSLRNQFCPPWPIHHRCLHIPNCCVVKRYQLTSKNVPLPIPRSQMARNDVCVELAYCLDCKGRRVPVFVVHVTLSCVRFYLPAMVVVVMVVVLGARRPPRGPLSPCHPPNGENTKAWV